MRTSVAIFFIFILAADVCAAQSTNQSGQSVDAYTKDSSGKSLRSGTGLCWRTGYWTPGDAVIGCDGDLTLPATNPISPALSSSMEKDSGRPVVVTPAVRRCDFTLVLDGDALFKSGEASISLPRRSIITSRLQKKLQECATINSLVVTGHTDRLGSVATNHTLSQKRAAAVASVIVGSGVTAPIEARGLGSTQPISNCASSRQKLELTKCLAVDRRATVEVFGIAK